MELKHIKKKIEEVRKNSKKRNFEQTFDLVFNLQNLDLKNPENKIDVGILLKTKIRPKKLKICLVIDQSMKDDDKIFDKILNIQELEKIKSDIKEIRKITHKFDKFVVLANVMPKFAQYLGRYLGPMGKMPSPKLGMVINPKTSLKDLYEKIQKTSHIQTKKNLVIQSPVGGEKLSDDDIAENILSIYNSLIQVLPGHKNNLKNTILKLTMSKGELL